MAGFVGRGREGAAAAAEAEAEAEAAAAAAPISVKPSNSIRCPAFGGLAITEKETLDCFGSCKR